MAVVCLLPLVWGLVFVVGDEEDASDRAEGAVAPKDGPRLAAVA